MYPPISRSGLSIDDLKRVEGVTDLQLDEELQEFDLPQLADYFDNTEDYVVNLGLTPGQQTDVRTQTLVNGTQIGMTLALRYWRNRNPGGGTFRALLLILLSLRKADVAFQVCKCELVDINSFVSVLSPHYPQIFAMESLWDLSPHTWNQVSY